KEKRKPKYDGKCRDCGEDKDQPYAVRFKTPQDGATNFIDLVKGSVSFQNAELDDLIILRSDGSPTYNFTVVVDDHEMNISHVIRGDDHLNNTPKQILFYRAFGWEIPEFAHVTLILGTDKKRLSKRHGAMSVMAYHDMGYLSVAVVNYLVRLGWSYEDQEIFTIEDLVTKFSLDGLGKSAGIFNVEKMTWVSGQHMKMMSVDSLVELVIPFLELIGFQAKPDEKLKLLVEACLERSKTLIELADWMRFYYSDEIVYEESGVQKFMNHEGLKILELLKSELSGIEQITKDNIEKLFTAVMERLGLKMVQIAQTARMALTGKTVSPGIFEVLHILGKERSITRIVKAINFIRK
ncbi:glutamate--tRNA ligase, partial [bacterium]|nr:glutamate--tRNA ligase [bacterium]